MLVSGRWIHRDGELVVASEIANPGLRSVLASQAVHVCESPHFAVYALDDGIAVLHRLEPAAIDNDLAELVAGELIRSRHVVIPRAFKRCFAGVILSSAPSSKEAWRAFYDNTLSKLQQVASGSYPGQDSGPIAVFGRIYQHAWALVAGSSLLDVGTCFGFFPLLLQRSDPPFNIVALDVSAPILELARDAAVSRYHVGTATFVHGDACSLSFADGSFDTVSALHLLEHLIPSSASKALQEMCRVARRKVIVAVPMEEELDPAYDHVQRFDRESLINLVEKTGWRWGFEDYLGGWVVLEPP
jgi:2-polyprenyl-3-methyl-5-hydroxy-6-metoxy-1,4-benzoquinol methylase